jgi:hypothetical protein
VVTILSKIRKYLDHPHVSRFLKIVSLRRRVRQPGSSFAKFIKPYGSRFFCKIRCNNSLTFLKRKEKGAKFLEWVCGFHFFVISALPHFDSFFFSIPSDVFFWCNKYLFIA